MSNDSKPRRFLRIHDVEHKIGLKKTRIYDLIADGKFPAPIKLTGTTNVWWEHVVDAWMDAEGAGENPGGQGVQSGGQSGGQSRQRAALRAV